MLLVVGLIFLLIAYWAEKNLVDIKINRKGFTHSPFTIPILCSFWAIRCGLFYWLCCQFNFIIQICSLQGFYLQDWIALFARAKQQNHKHTILQIATILLKQNLAMTERCVRSATLQIASSLTAFIPCNDRERDARIQKRPLVFCPYVLFFIMTKREVLRIIP